MGPRFLCIGAMKSGTSWLSYNLKSHPQLWLPPVKELHYFNHHGRPWGRGVPIVCRDINSRRRARKYIVTEWKRVKNGKNARQVLWALRYFFLPPGDKWYSSLFPNDGRLSGEATPGYAALPRRTIQHVREVLPDLRFIYLLRNPVHRDWSHASMWLGRPWRGGKRIDEASDAEILRQLRDVRRSGSSDYVDNLERWEQFFPKDRFFVAFFEEIEENPKELLLRIHEFLGVEASEKYVRPQVSKKVGAGQYSGIPDRYATHLAKVNYEGVLRAHDRFHNSYTSGWLDYARQCRGGSSGGGLDPAKR